MHDSAILEKTGVVSRPGTELLLLGGEASLFELYLARAFNALWVVADRSAFLSRGFVNRVFSGCWDRLPFEDSRFGTVVVGPAWFQGLPAADVSRALGEVARVCGEVLLIVAGASGDDPESARFWWESQLLESGWRRHTRFFGVLDFERLEGEQELVLVMERLPAATLAAHPLEALRAERNLHMDMLRETGRRSDAHLARYEWARGWIKPGDVVVDAACGLGYGAAILWDGAEAASVTGLDITSSAIVYATDCFSPGRPGLSYRVADVETWEGFADHSIDCIVSFETIEHLARPDLFLHGARRVLKPGGRFLCSVPNEWLDSTGRDPNPFHLHVFNLDRLVELVAPRLLVDEVYAQSAGGHAARFAPRRTLRQTDWADPAQAAASRAEWWLLSAVSDPIAGASEVPYLETVFPAPAPVPNAIAFSRDYVNPWAIHALVMGCHRVRSPKLLRELAARWLAASPEDSADAGAALCILAYRGLQAGRDPDSLLLVRLADYRRLESRNAQVRRWQISLAFVEGLWRLKAGDFATAEDLLRWCAGADASAFAPHLETKTTEAAWLAGRLALERGDDGRAAADWRLALAALERLRSRTVDDWLVVPQRPAAFEHGDGLREIATAIDSAALAANGLRALADPLAAHRPGRHDIERNFQRNTGRLVAEIHSRGGYILQLRDQVAAQQQSIAALQQQGERATLALSTVEEQLAAARLEATAAEKRARRSHDDLEALAVELRASRDARQATDEALAMLQSRAAALQQESAQLLSHLAGEQQRASALDAELAAHRSARIRTDAERAALRGALRRLMPRVIVVGAGDDVRRVWEALTRRGTVEVVGIIDGDHRRHDRPFLGTHTRPVSWLNERAFDAIALAGPPSREIRERLKQLAIPADTLITFPADADDETVERIAGEWFPDPLAAMLTGRSRSRGLRLGIFGTGSGAMRVWEALSDLDDASAVWFADNNPQQQGQQFLWLDVIAPAAIIPAAYDAIVIGSMSIEPIRRQLVGLGVPADRLLTPNVTGSIAAIREELAASLAALEEVSRS